MRTASHTTSRREDLPLLALAILVVSVPWFWGAADIAWHIWRALR